MNIFIMFMVLFLHAKLQLFAMVWKRWIGKAVKNGDETADRGCQDIFSGLFSLFRPNCVILCENSPNLHDNDNEDNNIPSHASGFCLVRHSDFVGAENE